MTEFRKKEKERGRGSTRIHNSLPGHNILTTRDALKKREKGGKDVSHPSQTFSVKLCTSLFVGGEASERAGEKKGEKKGGGNVLWWVVSR